jgi:uncharacterized protein YqgC (DUF456 family)
MKKIAAYILPALIVLVPVVALAQTPNFGYVNSWLNQAIYWLRLAITVIMILMTFVFLYNVFRFIMNKDASKVAEYRGAMIRGLIGLFVAVAVWGIIRIAGNLVGVDVNNQSPTPGITCPPGMRYIQQSGTCER